MPKPFMQRLPDLDPLVADDQLGSRITARREQLGLDQLDLATRSGVKQSTLSELESGKSKSISGLNLARLCRELRLTPEYLIGGGREAADPDVAVAEAEACYIIRQLGSSQRETLLVLARALLSPSKSVLPEMAANELTLPPQSHPRH